MPRGRPSATMRPNGSIKRGCAEPLNSATHRELIMHGYQVLTNPAFKNPPFKIELDCLKQLPISPALNAHDATQADRARVCKGQFKQRERVYSECSIQTHNVVRVENVVWAPDAFVAADANTTRLPLAPELRIAINWRSLSKTAIASKASLYFVCSAQAVWEVSCKRLLAMYVECKLAARNNLVNPVVI